MRIAICKRMRCVWDDRRSHSGRFCFPLCHYHGMTLGFDLDIAVPALKDFFGGFSVDLYELQKSIAMTRNRL